MKKIIVLLICAIVGMTAQAEKVTEQEALQKAQTFLQRKHFKQKTLKSVHRAPQIGQTDNAFYIFNVENNGGFVIVSGDDRMTEILGYSEHGSFDLLNAPENVRWWLGQYEQAVAFLDTQGTKVSSRRTTAPKEDIAPFITTTWGQDYPYNAQCPKIDGKNCVAGCVATAMAQVINYTKWPEGETGEIGSYTTKTNQIAMPKLNPTTFDWNNMKKAADISRLMLYCGQSVGTDYGLRESGASDARIPGALISIFGYDQGVHIIYRNGYNNETWETIIYNELKAGRPVIYGGQSDYAGHSFICHGYQDGKFYINWGWNGMDDGYFSMTDLDYSKDQTAVIGIQKSTGNEMVSLSQITVTKVTLKSDETLTRNSSVDNFMDITLETVLQNSFIEDRNVQVGYALYFDTDFKQMLDYKNESLSPGLATTYVATVSFGKELVDGKYRVVSVYRETESSDWIVSEGADWKYFEAVIEGNKLSLNSMPDAAHDERLKYRPHSIDEVFVSAINQNIEGDIVIPKSVLIEGKPYKVIGIDNNGFSYCTKITSIKMPSSMKYWLIGAFTGCTQLKTLTIPKSLRYGLLTELNTMSYCVTGCENLEEIIIEKGNKDFCVVDGALLSADKTLLIAYPGGLPTKEYTIPNSVENMEDGVFGRNKRIETVTWSSKMDYIPIDAFLECTALKELRNIDHVTSIGHQAFWGAGFEVLKLPSNLKEIGVRGFTGCQQLKTLELPQSLKNIGDYAFGGCSKLDSIIIRNSSPLPINPNVFSEDIYQNAVLYVPIGRANYFRQAIAWGNFQKIEEIEMPDVVISDNPFDNINENQMLFGYYRSDYTENGIGGYNAGLYKACIGVERNALLPFEGSAIKHIRFALTDKKISDVKLWIGSALDKEDLCQQVVSSVNVGWNVVTLDKPYIITRAIDTLFIGIEYKQKNDVYPISVIWSPIHSGEYRSSESGSCLLYGPYAENGDSEWNDLHDIYCMSIQCLLEGDHLPLYDVHMSSIWESDHDEDAYYYKVGESRRIGYSFLLKNWGKKMIGGNFHLKAEIDGQELMDDNGINLVGNNLNGLYAYPQRYYIKLPDSISAGNHKLRIYVDEINGEKPLFPDDDSAIFTLRVYKEGMRRQKILMENITSTWCHDALNTNMQQDLLLDENDDLALVSYHCEDELTSEASEEFFKRYSGVIGLELDANRIYGASTSQLEKLREMPAFVEVNIDAEYDKETRLLNIYVEGNRNDDCVLLHPSLNLSVYLTEDNLVAPQYDEMNETMIIDYKHKGVLQTCASNLWGDPIIWDENHYKMNYSIYLDEDWNKDNMHIIAFIEEDLDGKTTGKPIINCNEMMVKDAMAMTIVETSTKETISQAVYNLLGYPILQNTSKIHELPKGIYIVNDKKVIVK